MNITLAHVASIAGVSEITVSRVLRNRGPIAEGTRQRVLDAVRITGYMPNRVAGALASDSSNLVGVVIPSVVNNVFGEVLQGINAALAAQGFQSVIGITDYDLDKEHEVVSSMLTWKPAGMIVTGLDHRSETSRALQNYGGCLVEIMDIDLAPLNVAIGLSHREAGAASVRHLVERGYRRFGYVGHDLAADRRAARRLEGVTAALADAGLESLHSVLLPAPSSIPLGADGLARLLAETPDLDVVLFSNDDMAVGGYFHCLGAGIAPRERLGLFGFNGLEIGQSLPRPLSSIRSRRGEIGRQAVSLILERGARRGSPAAIDTGFDIIVGATA